MAAEADAEKPPKGREDDFVENWIEQVVKTMRKMLPAFRFSHSLSFRILVNTIKWRLTTDWKESFTAAIWILSQSTGTMAGFLGRQEQWNYSL